jgi:hypothetical protein
VDALFAKEQEMGVLEENERLKRRIAELSARLCLETGDTIGAKTSSSSSSNQRKMSQEALQGINMEPQS